MVPTQSKIAAKENIIKVRQLARRVMVKVSGEF
jgi:hypothetical protein